MFVLEFNRHRPNLGSNGNPSINLVFKFSGLFLSQLLPSQRLSRSSKTRIHAILVTFLLNLFGPDAARKAWLFSKTFQFGEDSRRKGSTFLSPQSIFICLKSRFFISVLLSPICRAIRHHHQLKLCLREHGANQHL